MPITSFTIAGSEVNPLFDSLDIRESTGNAATLSCDVVSVGSPVQRFAVHQEIIVQEDSTTIFAGHVTQALEKGFGGPNLYDADGAPQIVTTITAEDYNRYAERIHVTEDVAEGTTLAAFLTTLVDDYLDQFGVALHASQATGPSLPAMTFDLAQAAEVLRALSDATGFVWRIDYDKKLRMWQPGDLAAPFDIDEFDQPAQWTGDVEVETILGDDYANKVIVISGPIQEVGRVESFTGDGVTDTFTLQFTPTKLPGIIHVYESDGVTPAGGETFGVPPDAPLQWEFTAPKTITRTIGATESGKIYKLTFDGTFTARAEAENAAAILANGLYEHIERRTDITDDDAAQDLADAILAERLNAGEQKVGYDTRVTAPTLHVGQQQAITATARDLSGNYILTDLRVRAETPATAEFAAGGLGLIRTVTVKQQNVLTGRWQDTYRDWLRVGGTASAAPQVGGGAIGQLGPAPPVKSVQFHHEDGGQFDGDASFTYEKTEHSVICGGGGSSITAASFQSCQVFGFNNHIADP